jgi:hypothetical protein
MQTVSTADFCLSPSLSSLRIDLEVNLRMKTTPYADLYDPNDLVLMLLPGNEVQFECY